MPSALTLDPTVNFFFAKTPVFPQPDTGQALDAALARSPIDPGCPQVVSEHPSGCAVLPRE